MSAPLLGLFGLGGVLRDRPERRRNQLPLLAPRPARSGRPIGTRISLIVVCRYQHRLGLNSAPHSSERRAESAPEGYLE